MNLSHWLRAYGPGSRQRLEHAARWLAVRYTPLVQQQLTVPPQAMTIEQARGYVRSWADLVMDRLTHSTTPPAPFSWPILRPLVVHYIVDRLSRELAGAGRATALQRAAA